MKNLAVSKHFQKQLHRLSGQDREKAAEALKSFLAALKRGEIPKGLGFKKINGDKYEIRVGLKIRIAMKFEQDSFVCHVIGDHEAIRHYLSFYRNR